jgi:alkane 1-monooxygenase
VYGHHRYVATPRDPATARFGESFYRFFPRTLAGSVVSALEIENERVRRRYGRALHPANRMLRYALVQLALYSMIGFVFGWLGVVVLAGQSAVAILELETINYVEHYGLMRRETSPGVFERVQPWHSWDAHYRVSNWLLINLARHADHHGIASRRYPALQAEPSTPQLPAGYGAMFLLALVPPLWRKVMDPRVVAERARHAVSG